MEIKATFPESDGDGSPLSFFFRRVREESSQDFFVSAVLA